MSTQWGQAQLLATTAGEDLGVGYEFDPPLNTDEVVAWRAMRCAVDGSVRSIDEVRLIEIGTHAGGRETVWLDVEELKPRGTWWSPGSV